MYPAGNPTTDHATFCPVETEEGEPEQVAAAPTTILTVLLTDATPRTFGLRSTVTRATKDPAVE